MPCPPPNAPNALCSFPVPSRCCFLIATADIVGQMDRFTGADMATFCRVLTLLVYDARDRYTSSSGTRSPAPDPKCAFPQPPNSVRPARAWIRGRRHLGRLRLQAAGPAHQRRQGRGQERWYVQGAASPTPLPARVVRLPLHPALGHLHPTVVIALLSSLDPADAGAAAPPGRLAQVQQRPLCVLVRYARTHGRPSP